MSAINQTPNSSVAQRKAQRGKLLVGLGAVVALSAAITVGWWNLYGQHSVSTDNAYTNVEIARISPSVGGTIAEVLVTDTQSVHAGDLLVRIDPADARFALLQAEANLDQTLRRVQGYYATDAALQAQVAAGQAEEKAAQAQLQSAEADFERARIDLDRRQALVKSGSISGDELTRTQNAFSSAQAALTAARAAATQASAMLHVAERNREANAVLINGTDADQHPEVAAARARRDQAQLDLQRTEVRSPVDGVVAQRQVQLGQRVNAGSPLLSVVPVQDIYVDANFKEGQLEQVRMGQKAIVTADIYGTEVQYEGVVEGFSAGTGSAFAAIPAQNATGNWIKVVQRLPLRIRLDQAQLQQHPLKVGLSMNVSIDTSSTDDHSVASNF